MQPQGWGNCLKNCESSGLSSAAKNTQALLVCEGVLNLAPDGVARIGVLASSYRHPTLATLWRLFLFLIVSEDPADEKYADRNNRDGHNDTHGGSHFFN